MEKNISLAQPLIDINNYKFFYNVMLISEWSIGERFAVANVELLVRDSEK